MFAVLTEYFPCIKYCALNFPGTLVPVYVHPQIHTTLPVAHLGNLHCFLVRVDLEKSRFIPVSIKSCLLPSLVMPTGKRRPFYTCGGQTKPTEVTASLLVARQNNLTFTCRGVNGVTNGRQECRRSHRNIAHLSSPDSVIYDRSVLPHMTEQLALLYCNAVNYFCNAPTWEYVLSLPALFLFSSSFDFFLASLGFASLGFCLQIINSHKNAGITYMFQETQAKRSCINSINSHHSLLHLA